MVRTPRATPQSRTAPVDQMTTLPPTTRDTIAGSTSSSSKQTSSSTFGSSRSKIIPSSSSSSKEANSCSNITTKKKTKTKSKTQIINRNSGSQNNDNESDDEAHYDLQTCIEEVEDPSEWSVEIVGSWLVEIDLQNYVEIFREMKVDGPYLLTALSEEEHSKVLIPDQEDRRRFTQSLKALLRHMPVTPGGSTMSDLPLKSWKYTITVKEGDTLETIAKEKHLSVIELLGANPTLSSKQKLNQDQKIFLPYIQHLIEDQTVRVSPNSHPIVPETFFDGQLTEYQQCLQDRFAAADHDENGYLNVQELKLFLQDLDLRTLSGDQMEAIFHDMKNGWEGELDFSELFTYLRSIIIMEDNFSAAKISLFKAMLTADHLNECALGGITQFINQTWTKFSQFRRHGQHGAPVMISGYNVAIVSEGQHSLVDLICWSDQLTESIEPKHAVIKGFKWRSKQELGPNKKDGEVIFPADFNGYLPIEIASVQNLKYYGCAFANETQLKIYLINSYEIVDFQYLPNYFDDFVLNVNQPGIEKHAFAHLDCPHGDHSESGYFIIGKVVDQNELHLTAFIIPSKHTLYVPSNTIHSNDYLRGKWRTMLTTADVDRVILKKPSVNRNTLEVFSFKFS
ncbi:unnamed protein product [Rotaria magnacalcarata]